MLLLDIIKATTWMTTSKFDDGHDIVHLLPSFRPPGRADKFLDFGYDVIMYSNEDKLRAVKLFHQYDRAWAHVLRELGYPSRSALKLWVRQYAKDPHVFEIRNRGKYSKEQQTTAVNYYFEHGRSSARAVRTLGFPSRSLLDLWVRKDSRFASVQPVASDQVHHPTKTKHTLPKTAPMRIAKLEKAHSDKLELNASTEKLSSLSHDELLHRAQDLELQNDILLQVNALLKKDLGIDHLNLTNREKTHVIDALRDKYALKTLLTALGLSKSSYFYQVEASAKGDKLSTRTLYQPDFKQKRQIIPDTGSRPAGIIWEICQLVLKDRFYPLKVSPTAGGFFVI